MEALRSSVQPSDRKDTGHGLRILDFLPGSLVPRVTLRGGEGKGDEEAQVACSCSTWTIPAVQGTGMGGDRTPNPTCLEALSDSSLQAQREALIRPLDTGSSCPATSLLQGALFQEPWGLALGQHNNHSGSCGLSAPLGLRGICSRLHGGAGTWPSDSWHNFPLPSTSPCSPEAETLLCPGLEAGTREKTQNRSKWRRGQRQPCPGSSGVLPLKEAVGQRGAKARKHNPNLPPHGFPACLRPSTAPPACD